MPESKIIRFKMNDCKSFRFHESEIVGTQPTKESLPRSLVDRIVGVDCNEDPPVPIPNTEVKLIYADNTWRETAWEDR